MAGHVTPWMPQPGPQALAIQKHLIDEIFYGGAVGGGKSDFLLGDFAQDVPQPWGKYCRGILFRRTYGELEDLIARSHEIYPQWFDLPRNAYSIGDKTWTWPNGATLKMRYLEHSTDWQRYWGHAYCVAVGTQIVMADGSTKAIEDIKPRELVQTLEGPRAVRACLRPYRAPCVLATVYDAENRLVGQQVHPISHPVLSIFGLSSVGSFSSGSRKSDQIFRQLLSETSLSEETRQFRLCADQESSGWRAYSEDDRTDDAASSRLCQDAPQLGRLSFPVVLHAQTVRSIRQREGIRAAATSEFCFPCISPTQFEETYRPRLSRSSGLQPLSELGQSIPESDAPRFPNAPAYGLFGNQTALGCSDDYPTGNGFHGGLVPSWSGNDQDHIQQQVDAAGRPLSRLLDEMGTTPRHIRQKQLSWEHPYTGEARSLRADVQVGRVVLEPCGTHVVADLEVLEANSYISASTGLVNKNTWIGWDELPSWPNLTAYLKMLARLRSAHAVPNKRVRSTGNPGGPGHTAVKAYFGIDRYPNGGVMLSDEISGMKRMFIKSKLSDNKILLEQDPGYGNRLKGLGSDALVQAWLEGDWNVVAGAFFDCWDASRHIIRPFEIPSHWTRFGSFDWGSAKPFSYGLWAISDGSPMRDGRQYTAGAMVRYREWYGNQKPDPNGRNKSYDPNTGLKLTAEEIARGIRHLEAGEKMSYRVADPACFSQDGGPSKAETMAKAGIVFQPADHARIAGWDQVRQRLQGDGDSPMMYIFSTCTDFIRTFPALQHDENKPEDVDTRGEDHIGDETRYAAMSRPFVRTAPLIEPMRGLSGMTMDELWKFGRSKSRDSQRI